MTRRVFTVGLAGLAVSDDSPRVLRDRDTEIVISEFDGDLGEKWWIGVRTSLKATHYLAEVFYKTTIPEFKKELLLHQESVGPVAGNEGYGATNQNFTCPRDKVQFIRVTFFQKLQEREFAKPRNPTP